MAKDKNGSEKYNNQNVDSVSRLTLKWGTIKGWDYTGNEKAKELLKEYYEIGSVLGCVMQRDTKRQKEIIIELIDLCNDPEGIYLDWDGKFISKEQAKDYVLNYGKPKGVE